MPATDTDLANAIRVLAMDAVKAVSGWECDTMVRACASASTASARRHRIDALYDHFELTADKIAPQIFARSDA